jgi:hypothetical protein
MNGVRNKRLRRRESTSTTTAKEAEVEATLAQLSDNQQPGEPKVAKKRKKAKAAPKRKARAKAQAGSKKAQVIAMLKRASGVSLDTIVAKTGWARHTVRGFISILGRSEKVSSERNSKGDRIYSIA